MANQRGNPNHPVVREVEQQWYKLCAIVMHKLGKTEVTITSEDIDAFANSGMANIVVHPKGHTMTLTLVGDAEASAIVKREGGAVV